MECWSESDKQKAIKINPRYEDAWIKKGSALQGHNNDKAIQALDKAIEINPQMNMHGLCEALLYIT